MNQNDLIARVLAVLLSGLAAVWASINSQDRFTGSDGKVLDAKIEGLRRDVDKLPPAWLQREINELERRVAALEERRE
jgi:polyhydroxyalkanoate synthesis regulator phasin